MRTFFHFKTVWFSKYQIENCTFLCNKYSNISFLWNFLFVWSINIFYLDVVFQVIGEVARHPEHFECLWENFRTEGTRKPAFAHKILYLTASHKVTDVVFTEYSNRQNEVVVLHVVYRIWNQVLLQLFIRTLFIFLWNFHRLSDTFHLLDLLGNHQHNSFVAR